jgi:outer membrane protein OmpA-like peptidoglycan-associated protein
MIARWMSSRRCAAHVVAAALFSAVVAFGVARADDSNPPPNASSAVGPSLPGRALGSRLSQPAVVTQLQARLDAIGAAGTNDCVATYQSHKAQAWINFAKYAAQNDAPASVRAAAVQNASDIMNGLDKHATAVMQTVELPQSRHERDDLWRMVDAVKGDGRLCAAPKMTAYCEVQLAWVGYEATEGGWRHVDPYVRIAEDYCVTASNAIPLPIASQVADVKLTPTPLASALPAIVSPEIAPVEKAAERIDVAIFVLFPHNRSRRTDIRPPGRLELATLAAHLKGMPKDTLINVVGHADVTGHVQYNNALSARRANCVAAELARQGIDPERIRVGAVGSADPIVSCKSIREHSDKRHYLACLEPNRRVVIQLVGETE